MILPDKLSVGCCRIKYIGRNCRVVLVGGTLLKAEQEVPAAAGARVVLNYNNKVFSRRRVGVSGQGAKFTC